MQQMNEVYDFIDFRNKAYEGAKEKPSIETTKNAFKIILPNRNAKYETKKTYTLKEETTISFAPQVEKSLSNEEKILKYACFMALSQEMM